MRPCKQKTRVHRFPPDEKFFPHLGEKVWWPRVTLSFLLNKYAMVLPSVVSNPTCRMRLERCRGVTHAAEGAMALKGSQALTVTLADLVAEMGMFFF